MTSIPPPVQETWYRRFQGVMPFRVREILLVSSAYDAFVLDEDGPLVDRLFSGYSELHLSQAPRITHASSASNALTQMKRRRFDLVLTVMHLPDGDAVSLSEEVAAQHPKVPVVLFVFDEDELARFDNQRPPPSIDHWFLWGGDARVLIAAIKQIEDAHNVGHDAAVAGVQVILVVEDEPRSWSGFLALLYAELMTQAHSLIEDGVNDQHRLMRMRARPRILHAKDYEEAVAIATRYGRTLLALISDLGFPKDGVRVDNAGFQLAAQLRKMHPTLPVLFQSSQPGVVNRANRLNAWHAQKRAPGFPDLVRRFLREALGFGDFLFRLDDGTVVARAQTVHELEELLHEIPAESLLHHADRHDFSVWLRARAMFQVANEIRPRTAREFEDAEAIRVFLIESLSHARDEEQEGVVTDVWAPPTARQNRFVRVGRGSLGGKGRGIAFVNSLIVRHGLLQRFEGLEVRVPRTIVVGTDVYDQFLDDNVEVTLREGGDAEAMRQQILGGTLDPDILSLLREAFRVLKGPLAVRSSTLLEDSRFRSFAGVYQTFMLPNSDPDPEVRFEQLVTAIKRVYASVYSERAQRYVGGTPHSLDDEKMGVVIQQAVGQAHGDRFYPHAAGVAQSYNYYPIGHQTADGGVASLVLGLGHLAVGGGGCLRFSPGAPRVLPQFPSAEAFFRGCQTELYAIDLSSAVDEVEVSVKSYPLSVAEEDGTLSLAGSVYSFDDDVIRDDLSKPGPRVVTFNNVLKHGLIPLARALRELLLLLRQGLASEVEMEFALDMADWQKPVTGKKKRRGPRLYLLQVRPMPSPELQTTVEDLDAFPNHQLLLKTEQALGHGSLDSVRDVIFIRRSDLDSRGTRAAAAQLRKLDAILRSEGRRYLLIGPGRWGSSDASLGIPVDWADIRAARVIAEMPLEGGFVEPSQGTHFFHNLTAARIGYLTITPRDGAWFDRAWLEAQPAEREDELVRHVRFSRPLPVHMDGRRGMAVILKPDVSPTSGSLTPG